MQVVIVLAILFIASIVKSSLGFGDALLAMPLLTLLLGIQTASPLMSLVGTVSSLLILFTSWRSVELRTTWRLALASVIGVPIGVWGLAMLPATWVTAVLGVVLIFAGVSNLTKPMAWTLASPHWAWPFGLAAGILGGAYNTSGPPLVLYASLRRWPADRFQATLQGCFLPASIVRLAGHGLAGLWTPQVLWYFALSIPLVLVAYWLGSRTTRGMPTERFKQVIDFAIVLLGVALIVQAVLG